MPYEFTSSEVIENLLHAINGLEELRAGCTSDTGKFYESSIDSLLNTLCEFGEKIAKGEVKE